MKKFRTIILLCGIAMFAATGTATAQTGGGTTGDLQWELVDSTLTITGEGAMPDYNYDPYGDQSDATWVNQREYIARVIIGDGVTSIGKYAFLDCSELTSVTIPNSVTTIGNSAFSKCSELTSVTIPNLVTTIGSSAFSKCSGLTSVVISNSVTAIGGSAFSNCTGLTTITISESITTIEGYTFSYCSGLTSIIIPESVTSIGNNAFSNCTGLTSIIIPEKVTTIWHSAFYGCSGLTSITIPESVTTINALAFRFCSSLTEVINHAQTPQTIIPNVFFNVDLSDCMLHVPAEAIDVYEATDVWNYFGTIVAIGATGTVNLSANPAKGGEVEGGGTFNNGEEITVTATPAANYTFVKWTEDGEWRSANAAYTFTVIGDRTLVANFALERFGVTFNQPENGTLTVTAGSETVANGSRVDYETVLTVTATPDENYKLQSLKVNGVDFASGGSHTVTGNVNIECTFTGTDATLASLTVSASLTPAFNSAITDYTADFETVDIVAIPSDTAATVAGAGIKQLQTGENVFDITVTAHDGVTAKTYTVRINHGNASIQETGISNKFAVYPNPVSSSFTVDYDGTGEVAVFDISGNKMLTQSVAGKTEITVHRLPAGVYTVQLFANGKTIGSAKIIKE